MTRMEFDRLGHTARQSRGYRGWLPTAPFALATPPCCPRGQSIPDGPVPILSIFQSFPFLLSTRDLVDVKFMLERDLISAEKLWQMFERRSENRGQQTADRGGNKCN